MQKKIDAGLYASDKHQGPAQAFRADIVHMCEEIVEAYGQGSQQESDAQQLLYFTDELMSRYVNLAVVGVCVFLVLSFTLSFFGFLFLICGYPASMDDKMCSMIRKHMRAYYKE